MDFEKMRKEGIYDYVANHYYELSKEELKDIALETMWALSISNGDLDKAKDLAIRTLKEIYEGDEL